MKKKKKEEPKEDNTQERERILKWLKDIDKIALGPAFRAVFVRKGKEIQDV